MATKKARGITKSEILNAGMALFLSKGSKVTVKDIADAANVSRQMVYQYFNSRSGLLTALARQKDENSGCKDRFYMAIGIENPAERLATCIIVWLNYVKEIQILANELNRNRHSDPDAESAYFDRFGDVKVWFSELFLSLKDNGAMKQDIQIQDAVDITFTIVSPQVYELLHSDQKWQHRKIVDHLSKIIHNTFIE